MKKAFMCSLCHRGILGGGLYLDDTAVTYKTQKLTVDRAYRKLVLPLDEIQRIVWKWRVFPTATFHMTDGTQYKFIIFNKGRFNKYYQAVQRGNAK